MTSFLGRLRGNANTSNAAPGAAPVKKDVNAPIATPLEKLLANAGPLRIDGSDKFFGFENFGSTCYANSIIQCLYYSPAFREQVISFPSRPSLDALQRPQSGSSQNGHALSPMRSRTLGPGALVQRSKTMTTTPIVQPAKVEENKDSPEYKKKQAMVAGPLITMDYENAKSYGMAESLFTALKDIFEAVIAHDSRVGVVSPYKFLEILRKENEMFRTPMHQDAHEFLNLLLNNVVETVEHFNKAQDGGRSSNVQGDRAEHNAAQLPSALPGALSSTTRNSRWVHELFEGTLTSETRCLTCENISQRDEPFLDLSVDLEQHSSVTSCLRKFSAEEMLCERNKFHCDNCSGLQEAEKRMKVKRLPRILALHLKRFKYTEDYNRLQKLFHRVVYPYYLRLFNTTDDAEDPDRLYELYAVVVHIGGGPYHGHYVSIVKTKEKGWLLFDDEMVEPVDKGYVKNFFGGEGNLACAYVLFYQETTVEAMQQELEAEGAVESSLSSKAADMQRDGPLAHALKTSGLANGSAYHSFNHTPTSPVASETSEAAFASIDRAYTMPVQKAEPTLPPEAPVIPPEPQDLRSPTLPAVLPRRKSQSHLQIRKEQVRDAHDARVDAVHTRIEDRRDTRDVRKDARKEEKEQRREEKEAKREEKARDKELKARERELEKNKRKEAEEAERWRWKELEDRKRTTYKQQDDQLRAAMAASRASKTEEDEKRANGNSFFSSSTEPSVAGTSEPDNTPTNGGPVGGAGGMLGLGRFRTSSSAKVKVKDKKEKYKDHYVNRVVGGNPEQSAPLFERSPSPGPHSQGLDQSQSNGDQSAYETPRLSQEQQQRRPLGSHARQSVPAMPSARRDDADDGAGSSTWGGPPPEPPRRSNTEALPREKEKERGFRFGFGRKKSMMYGS